MGTEAPLAMEYTSRFPLAPPLARSEMAAPGSMATHPPVPPVWARPTVSRTVGVAPAEGPENAVRDAAGNDGWRLAGVTPEPAVLAVPKVLSRIWAPPAVPNRQAPYRPTTLAVSCWETVRNRRWSVSVLAEPLEVTDWLVSKKNGIVTPPLVLLLDVHCALATP